MEVKQILAAAVLGAGLLGAGSASAEYYVSWAVGSVSADFADYGGAMVHVTGQGYDGYLTFPTTEYAQYATADTFADNKHAQGQLNVDAVGDYLFQIELYDETGDSLIALSEQTSWAEVKDALGNPAISTPLNPSTGVWTVGAFHAVPEPTSGLLTLLGLAALALRRKRA